MKLTIFTPTFNRGYILPALYESLCNQTCKEFEWVVVDDGSTDNTSELIGQWKSEDKVNLKYLTQSNQGKHIAINTGVKNASGELFFIVDSDDTLKDNAVEAINNFFAAHTPFPDDISGIIGYREFFDGMLVGTLLPEELKQCKLRDCGSKFDSYGDKVVIYKTNILRRFPFPKFGNERFLGENYVFDQIDDEYDMFIMRERIYRFGYQEDGLSQDFRKLYRNNPIGFRESFKQSLKYLSSPRSRIKTLAHIQCLSIKTRDYKSFVQALRGIGPVSIIPALYLYWKIFIRKVSDVKPFEKSSELK